MRAQLFDGQDLDLTDELRERLRDQISTDEITPAYICYFYDETLGDFPYLGLRTTNRSTGETEYPVTRSSVKDGGFVCSVAGKRRGKGSSREQSPYAELMAGIQVVVAESIERIYNENCQNLGDAHHHGLLRAGAHPRRRGDPPLGVHRGQGRHHPPDHRVRRALRVQRGAPPGQGDAARAREPAPTAPPPGGP